MLLMQTTEKQQWHSLDIGVDHFSNQLKRTKDSLESTGTSVTDPQHYNYINSSQILNIKKTKWMIIVIKIIEVAWKYLQALWD